MVTDDGPPPASGPQQPHPATRYGRAGRNLLAAVGVGLVLGALVLVTLLVVKAAFVGLALVAILVATWELSSAMGQAGIRVPLVPVALGAVAMLVGGYLGGPSLLVVALALTVLSVLVWRLGDGRLGFVRDTTAGTFTALYVAFLAGFAVLLLRPDDGHLRVVTFILVVVGSDIGGYLVGVLLGRHPMAPTVSPRKSWEGFAGSVAVCVALGVLAVTVLLGGPWWAGAVLGAATACAATLGDLGESMIKRDLGIKDMGTLLPGHGGIMDRLDSLLPAAPIAWALLTALVPVAT